jgi:hypothetical protein
LYGPDDVTTDFVSVGKPAAGANQSVQFSRDFAVRIIAARATLTTDANVADRLLSLDFLPSGADTWIRNAATVLITASTTALVTQWDTAHHASEWQTGTPVFVPVFSEWINCPLTVQFTVDNKQAGDQLTALGLVVQRLNP